MVKSRVLVLSSVDHPEVLAEVAALREFFDVDYEHVSEFDRRQLKRGLIALMRNLRDIVPAFFGVRFPPFPIKDFAENTLCASLLIDRMNRKHESYDIIFSNWLFPAGFAGLFLSKILGCKTVCVPRGYDIQALPGSTKYGVRGYRRIISKYVMNKSDAIVVTHQVHRSTAIRLCGASIDKKITYVASALPDLTKVRAGGDELPRSILDSGIAGSRKTVLYSPSLNPIYGILDLVSAIPLVLQNAPETFFVIIGKGSLERRVRDTIEKKGLTDDVLMVGKVDYNTMLALYRRADIVCDLACFGSGTTTIEAFCFAKPVIAVASPKRYVRNGRDGFEVNVGDYQDLATKLVRLLNDNELRLQMSRNARQSFETNFSLSIGISKIRQLIVSLTESKGGNLV